MSTQSYDPWRRRSEGRKVDKHAKRRMRTVIDYMKTSEILKPSGDDRDLSLVDVGCGDGAILGLMNRDEGFNGVKIVGIDHSPIGLTWAGHKVMGGQFYQFDLTEKMNPSSKLQRIVEYKDEGEVEASALSGEFDITICLEVAEHLPKDEDVVNLLQTIKRLTRRRGHIIFSVPDDSVTISRNHDHRRDFTWDEVGGLLAAAGFKDIVPIEYDDPKYWIMFHARKG